MRWRPLNEDEDGFSCHHGFQASSSEDSREMVGRCIGGLEALGWCCREIGGECGVVKL